jgi:hypothetical protein
MNLPGFNADVSLYRPGECYQQQRARITHTAARVVPAETVYLSSGDVLYCCYPCKTLPSGAVGYCCDPCGSIPSTATLPPVTE